MKTAFIGGVKSGKSRLAEDYILKQYDKTVLSGNHRMFRP